MTTDWNKPANSDAYTTVLGSINDKALSCGKILTSGDSNKVSGLKNYNTTTNCFENYNGSSYDKLGLGTSWTPTITGGGSMTISGTPTIQLAKYWRHGANGDLLSLHIDFYCVTAGSAAPELNFSLPSGFSQNGVIFTPVILKVSGGPELGGCLLNGTVGTLYRSPFYTNWPIGANQGTHFGAFLTFEL